MAGVFTSTLLLLLLSKCFAVISGACNSAYGPAGGYECVALSKYNGIPQWATCLTDTYIQAKSKSMGKSHQCENRSAT
ncbi:hypothetical protein KP79_PYT18847 [Mizuhopecten yessoensis]|uniref:Uncharacterized protein n=1 Tax=Mizuhopecten yessoensis TaxID=6573 RepID=A0A210QV01_MIZYE|nr:hypothetical protein KP79_PYT18847 [Mizuhopecten yessoensis]